MVTPFLKPMGFDWDGSNYVERQGGTLYVFPSVSKDLTRTFVSNEYEFKFSHFACLNIPDIRSGEPYMIDGSDSDEIPDTLVKGLYLEKLYKDNILWSSDGMGKVLAEHFQNYIFNFETAILNGEGDQDAYDPEIMTTISEKIFFNWLQKVGAIEFNGNVEKYNNLSDRTVQYIGNIDVTNTVEELGDTYEELYIHIPSSVGASTTVLFRNGNETDNKNYLNKTYHLNGDNENTIIGRTFEDPNNPTTPYGLSGKVIVDIDEGGNAYTGDSGHTIDFRDSSYENGEGISNMNANSPHNFEFNTVLIYYDFYEKLPDNTKKVSTNLYGVLFLDNIKDITGENSLDNSSSSLLMGYIQRYPKMKESFYGNGNSFALKVDFKIDTLPDATSVVEKYKNENDIVSMSLYEKSLVQLQKCIDLFFTQKTTIQKLEERILTLETMIMGIDKIDDLKNELNKLWGLYNNVGSNESLQGIIEEQSKKIDSILKGEKNIKLQYNTDVLQAGDGIKLDKSINKVVINSSDNYKIRDFYSDIDMKNKIESINTVLESNADVNNCYTSLRPGENFSILHINNLGVVKDDINIYIDDSEYNWERGQTFKIYVDINNPSGNKFRYKEGLGFIIKTCVEHKDGEVLYNQSIGSFIDDIDAKVYWSEFEEEIELDKEKKTRIMTKNLIEIIYIGDDSSGNKQFIYLVK